MRSYYSGDAIQKLIERYIERGGHMVEVVEGSLGYGTTLLLGDGLKTTVIQEHYLNEWSSGHTVRMYNKLPAKYKKLLDERSKSIEQWN